MKYWQVIMSLIFICSSELSLMAQTCCSAGAPITSSFDIGNSTGRGLTFSLDYEYNSVNLLIDNNERLSNDPRTRDGHNIVFKTDFSLNKNWAFSAFLPVVLQNRTTFSEMENATGLGDLTLLGQYSTYLGQTVLKWSAGVKLPTGNQFITDDRGINLSPDMQSGSGTFDFIGRAAILKEHVFIQNLSNQTSLSYRYNTTNDHFGDPNKENGRQFKFGNETQLTSSFSYLFLAKQWFIIPNIGLQLRHSSPNQEQSMDAPNSGGYWIRLPLGIQLKPNDQFSFRFFGEIPIKQYLNGLQITTDYKIGFQVAYQIPLASQTTTLGPILRTKH